MTPISLSPLATAAAGSAHVNETNEPQLPAATAQPSVPLSHARNGQSPSPHTASLPDAGEKALQSAALRIALKLRTGDACDGGLANLRQHAADHVDDMRTLGSAAEYAFGADSAQKHDRAMFIAAKIIAAGAGIKSE